MKLKRFYDKGIMEAGCDEAGRGCLAGPVYAAAVILSDDYFIEGIDDSKKLSHLKREKLRLEIEQNSLAWAVASVSSEEIDRINILNASFLAMHKAVSCLKKMPQLLVIDGNRFKPYDGIEHVCVVKGDSKYLSVAAASILAKTYRDEYMLKIDKQFPEYQWKKNKGYATEYHRDAILKYGYNIHHRKTFHIKKQLKLIF